MKKRNSFESNLYNLRALFFIPVSWSINLMTNNITEKNNPTVPWQCTIYIIKSKKSCDSDFVLAFKFDINSQIFL